MTKLSDAQESFRKKMTNPLLFRLFLLFKIPLGFLSGMKVVELNKQRAVSTVKYKWLNRNPFRSLYFGVQAMTAELCTGTMALMAIYKTQPSIAGIVTGVEGEFLKQAKGRMHFTCEDGKMLFDAVEKCKTSDEGQIVKVKSTGTMKDGTVVAIFHFTWSFKKRSL